MTPYNPNRKVKGHMAFNEQSAPAFADAEPIDFDDNADAEDRNTFEMIEETRKQLNQDKKNRK